MKKQVENLNEIKGSRADSKTKSKKQQSSTSSVVADLFKRIEINRKYAL